MAEKPQSQAKGKIFKKYFSACKFRKGFVALWPNNNTMNLTPQEILDSAHLEATKNMRSISTKHFPIAYLESALCAMRTFAEQEAKSFANWLSNQPFSRKTIDELWKEYNNI